MFHYFFTPLVEDFSFLNLFNYITFRAGGALFTAFLISIFFGPKLISYCLEGQTVVTWPLSITKRSHTYYLRLDTSMANGMNYRGKRFGH